MSSICLNLDQSKILSSGNGLKDTFSDSGSGTFPEQQILNSKSKYLYTTNVK